MSWRAWARILLIIALQFRLLNETNQESLKCKLFYYLNLQSDGESRQGNTTKSAASMYSACMFHMMGFHSSVVSEHGIARSHFYSFHNCSNFSKLMFVVFDWKDKILVGSCTMLHVLPVQIKLPKYYSTGESVSNFNFFRYKRHLIV